MNKFTLGREDLSKILKGACIAMAGAFLTYIAQSVGKYDFGTMTPVVVAVISILVNAGLKVIDGRVQ